MTSTGPNTLTSFAEFHAFVHVRATKHTYTPTRALRREIYHEGSGVFVECPVGDPYDVSSPWWATPFFDPHDPIIIAAAMVHDQMIREGYAPELASAELYRCLIERGYSKFKSKIALHAVIYETVK